jgi:hypothetical protein
VLIAIRDLAEIDVELALARIIHQSSAATPDTGLRRACSLSVFRGFDQVVFRTNDQARVA